MTEIFAEPTGQTSGVDVDGLLSQIEQPGSHEIPMSAPPKANDPATTTPQAPASEFEFNWNGKKIKASQEQLTQWASQGYNYAQKMQEFNQKLQGFEKERETLETKYNPYKQVDEYFAKNPEQWKEIESRWKQGANGHTTQPTPGVETLDPSNPLARELQAVKSQLGELSQFKQELVTKEQTQKREAEDKKLMGEIESIKSTYKDFSFDSPDSEGKTLEYKVLEYANQNGIRNFKDAFIAFNHDQIVQKAESRAKETFVKDQQKRTKLGLLGESSTPKKQLSEVRNIKSKSYENLLEEAKEEFGIG